MTYANHDRLDMARIDLEARRMRAETLRNILTGLSTRVRNLFSGGHGATGRAA